jgi:hypothetical protein
LLITLAIDFTSLHQPSTVYRSSTFTLLLVAKAKKYSQSSQKLILKSQFLKVDFEKLIFKSEFLKVDFQKLTLKS